jgi:hypothetical protein
MDSVLTSNMVDRGFEPLSGEGKNYEIGILQLHRLYHGEHKLIVNEMMMRTDLYQTYTLTWICIVLAH